MVTETSPKARRARILLAEDDAAIAAMVSRVLGQHYDVTVATNGHEAVRLASDPPPPDLLLLDVMMPGLDGFSVAAHIRTLPQLERVPIIFLTARGEPRDMVKGIQRGAKHYITKPFRMDDLVAKVKKILPRP